MCFHDLGRQGGGKGRHGGRGFLSAPALFPEMIWDRSLSPPRREACKNFWSKINQILCLPIST